MENRNMGNANDAYNPNEDWRKAENNDRQSDISESEIRELRDAQVQGYGTDPAERAYVAAGRATDDKDRENETDRSDDDDEDQEDADTDWGNVDPLDSPGTLPDPMDPSGPGSAV